MKQAYFDTLNEALESENLVKLWPLGSNIQYGQTIQHIVEDGKCHRLISVYRENLGGRYERPITYWTD